MQEDHIWWKHRVTAIEVEEICFSDHLALRGRRGSYAVHGETEAGRMLVVYLYEREPGVFAMATARDMTETERRRYRRLRRR